MKKLALTIAMAVTLCNIALGVTYAAVCEDTKGNRFCGNTCASNGSGGCSCGGNCSKDEMDWVAAGKHAEEELEMLDY